MEFTAQVEQGGNGRLERLPSDSTNNNLRKDMSSEW